MEPDGDLSGLDDEELAQAAILVDDLIIKAAGASDEVRIMAMERKLWETFGDEFQDRAVDAVAALDFMDGDAPMSQADARRIRNGVRQAFSDFAKAVKPAIRATQAEVWKLSQRQVADRLNGKLDKIQPGGSPHVRKAVGRVEPSFDLVDNKAVDALAKTQTVWIGEHFNADLSNKIKQLTDELMLRQGLGRKDAGAALRSLLETEFGLGEAPSRWMGTQANYFEGIAAVAVTNARVHAGIRQMADVGVTHYEIVNPDDERTCDRCRYMDGRKFEVKHALDMVDSLAEMGGHPDEVKAIHPWPKSKEMLERAEASGVLEKLFPLPPYHMLCRCGVDVTEDAEFNLEPGKEPPAKPEKPVPRGREPANLKLLREGKLDSDRMRRLRGSNSGVNQTYVAEVEHNGIVEEAIWKPVDGEEDDLRSNIKVGSYYKREVAAFNVAKQLGVSDLIPTTVAREVDGVKGSLQAWARGAVAKPSLPIDIEAMERVRVYDFVIGNSDRHGGNIMWHNLEGPGVSRPVLIDHGLAFPNGKADRFIQPVYANMDLEESQLSKKTIDFINSIDERELVKTLHEAGIERHAARSTVLRVRKLKDSPKFLGSKGDAKGRAKRWQAGMDKVGTIRDGGNMGGVDELVDEFYK